MILLQHRNFTDTDIDPVCLKTALSQLVEICESKFLNADSDITGTEKSIDGVKTVIK